MIPVHFDYVAVKDLAEAAKLLKQRRDASILAGGLSLLTDIKLHRAAPSLLVDLCKIGALRGISRERAGGDLCIGAMTTYAEIGANQELKECCPALDDAVATLGDQQVRNRGTIGGNLAHNHPAADLPAVALALEAKVRIAGTEGTRTVPADTFFTGPFTTSLAPGEIVTAVDFPAHASGVGSVYEKFKNPASGYALCGVAVMIERSDKGTVQNCRVAVVGASDHVQRLSKVESAMTDKEPTPENIRTAASCVTDEQLNFMTDLHASAEYRAHLTAVLTERSLLRAVERW